MDDTERTLHERNLLHMHLSDEDTIVSIDHLYMTGEQHCDDCNHTHRDPGAVGLVLTDDEDCVTAILSPGEALIVANRIQRAVSLIMEDEEDAPDFSREVARLRSTLNDDHPPKAAPPAAPPLARELCTFEAHHHELLARAAGKHALVHGDDLAGEFDTENDAVAAGYKLFGNIPFLVKKIEDEPQN